MYDWNENSSAKSEYIANKTHWIEFGGVTPLCGGDQRLPGSTYEGVHTYLYYTEYRGTIWIPNVNTKPVSLTGPSYVELVLEPKPDGSNDAHYHITPVFTHSGTISCQAGFKNLLDIACPGHSSADGIYYKPGNLGVHIKKTEDFESDGQFINYCTQQLNDLAGDALCAKAKELLDTYAYTVAGGWTYVTYDNTADQNSKIYMYIMNPNETYRNYWGVLDVDKQYSRTSVYFTGPRTQMGDGTVTGYGEYGNTVLHGFIMFDIKPESSWVNDSSLISGKLQQGTWGEMGETGLSTYIPETYHTLDPRYLPQEIKQMFCDISNFLNRNSHEAISL